MLNEFEKKIFQKVIRDLTFSPSIVPIDFMLSVVHNQLGRKKQKHDILNSDEWCDKLYIAANRHLQAVLARMLLHPLEKCNLDNLVSADKKYDEVLKIKQIQLYNNASDLFEYSPISSIYSDSIIRNSINLDGGVLDEGVVNNFFPYYVYEKRKGFSFVEYIFLLNIYLVTHKRTLLTLDKKADTSLDVLRVENLSERITKSIESQKTYLMYVDAFFEVLYDGFSERCNRSQEEWIRLAWLPEHYKSRKDAYNAYKKHGEYQGDLLEDNNFVRMAQFYNTMDNVNFQDSIFLPALAIAKDIMLNTYRSNGKPINNKLDKYDVDSDDYKLAKKYVKMIRAYIAMAIKKAKVLSTNFFNLT